MQALATVVLIGTCDTKLQELLFLREQILQDSSVKVLLVDVGRGASDHNAISIRSVDLSARDDHGRTEDVPDLPRSELITRRSRQAASIVSELHAKGAIHAIISAGGSSGTTLAASVMRKALPLGFPKLIVSTIASGDVAPLVQDADIALMPSVVDVAGLNPLLRDILSNAGAAISAAAQSYARRQLLSDSPTANKKRVGLTMFGVTTPGVDAIRAYLESNYDVESYVFHATGKGGMAMERLIQEGKLDAILDITTTEICDLVTGGVMAAKPNRLDAAIKAGIPNIVSLGALDMTNWGPRATIPPQYRSDRLLYDHTSVVTLMRTSEEESRRIADFISRKLAAARVPENVELWIPLGGISAMAIPGGPFADKAADTALFDALRQGLKGSDIKIVEHSGSINSPAFAHDVAVALAAKIGL